MATERRNGWTCKLCSAPIINIDRYVLPSCCKKEYLHWNCVQELVDKGEPSSFYCPLCTSEDDFVESMKSSGISFPANVKAMKAASSSQGTGNDNLKGDWIWTPRNKKQEELFHKAKDELHTFLAMNKEGIRLNDAFNMMFTQAAITIPLREMGFDNFYHFIYNCQEVSSLKQLPDRNVFYLFVKGNVDEQIIHIRALVQKQKWREKVPSCGVRVTAGNTYEVDPSILLQYRHRPREKLPILKPERVVEEEPPTAKVSAEVVHVIPLNKAAAADPRNLVVLPAKSTRKSKNKNSELSRINERMSKAAISECGAKEPEEFKARLLGVDQHGWFYVRKVTEQVAHWDKFMREFKLFYESDEAQNTLKSARKDVCLGATVVANYTPQGSTDRKFGRVTVLGIDDSAGRCTVQDIDESDVGDAALSDLYTIDEQFTEDERPRGATRVALAGTEMFILSGRIRRKFMELKLGPMANITVVKESHPIFECPVVNIEAWNANTLRFENLKSLLNM